MISRIRIENFKSLKNIDLPLRRLNLLTGLNGMGKSTLIQSILVLRQSRNLDKGEIGLTDYLVDIGKGKDAMYQYSSDEHIKFQFEFENQEPLNWNIKFNPDSNTLESKEKYDFNKLLTYSILSNNNFQYLKAEHESPKPDYATSYADVNRNYQVGESGAYTVHFLNTYGSQKIKHKPLLHPKAKSDTLIHQVDAWLGEITPGVKLNTTEVPGTDRVILDFQFEAGPLYTNRFKPSNVGFGLTYVLPVIVSLLFIRDDKLIILENPESHIHPRGQAELGKLMALSAKSGAQIIAETHSDHIINGVRVAVKKDLIDKNDAGIYYFDRVNTPDEQYSDFRMIQIDQHGELSEYPKNFLDEWSNQLIKLV